MKEIRDRHIGPLTVNERCTIWGGVTGDLRIVEGGKCWMRGHVGGDVIVDYGGRAHIFGHVAGGLMLFRGSKVILSGVVAGNATNDNARLYINKHGRVLGKTRTKGKHAETQTEESWGVKLERGK